MSKYISTYSCQINGQDDDQSIEFTHLINEVSHWSVRNNPYKIFYTRTLNLLLMGKLGTGKSTIAQVLENPCFIPLDRKLYSRTKQISIHPVAIDIGEEKNFISCFNLIDTPGMLFNRKQFQRTMNKCLEEDLSHIHLFAFVINLQMNLDEEEINSMILIKKSYPNLHRFIVLIVTHAEESQEEEREEKLNEFFRTERIASENLKELFEGRIFFLGALRSQLIAHPNRQAMIEQCENIHRMRNRFIQFLISLDAQDYFHIRSINRPKTCTLL